MAIHPGIFRQYDIRGIVDKDLTVDAATVLTFDSTIDGQANHGGLP